MHFPGLLGQTDINVETTALKIIASMKRDWMQVLSVNAYTSPLDVKCIATSVTLSFG